MLMRKALRALPAALLMAVSLAAAPGVVFCQEGAPPENAAAGGAGMPAEKAGEQAPGEGAQPVEEAAQPLGEDAPAAEKDGQEQPPAEGAQASDEERNGQEEKKKTESGVSQAALDLALKGISLSQGENGFEIWRLKAEWANLEKQDDLVVTKKPRLTYFMKDGDSSIFVEAEQGEVNQKTQILRFVDMVRASQGDRQLSGSLLVYNGNDKTMSMPEGARFTAAGMDGTSGAIVWHIDGNIIEASGGVSVLMETSGATRFGKVSLDKLSEQQLGAGQNGESE